MVMLLRALAIGSLIMLAACSRSDPGAHVEYARDGQAVPGSVTFEYTPEEPVQSVYLTGDFAAWNATAIPLLDTDGDGTWKTSHHFTAGRYQYKFVVDERWWIPDPRNPERVDDHYGGENSVLMVLDPTRSTRAAALTSSE